MKDNLKELLCDICKKYPENNCSICNKLKKGYLLGKRDGELKQIESEIEFIKTLKDDSLFGSIFNNSITIKQRISELTKLKDTLADGSVDSQVSSLRSEEGK